MFWTSLAPAGGPGYRTKRAVVRQPSPSFPVYLLHGSVDNVVPPSESKRIAEWASDSTLLISDLVVHVEMGEDSDQGWFAKWELASFWSDILRE